MPTLNEVLACFNRTAPATKQEIVELQQRLGVTLPDDYQAFLLQSNGANGDVAGVYLELWPVGELAERNASYCVEDFIPGLLLIGSDGGGEAVALDLRTTKMPIVNVPFSVMELASVRPLAPSLTEFLANPRRILNAGQP